VLIRGYSDFSLGWWGFFGGGGTLSKATTASLIESGARIIGFEVLAIRFIQA
jgi:hypothetical protein